MSAALVRLPRPASMAARFITRRSSRVSARPGLGDPAVGWRAPVKGFEPHIIGLLVYPGGGPTHVWLDR